MPIKIIATIQKISDLEKIPADAYYFGQSSTSSLLAQSFSNEELKIAINLIHQQGKIAIVAANALMSQDKIQNLHKYLFFLENIGVDFITISDPGVIYLLRQNKINLPFIYESSMFLTSAKQVNFWSKQGASLAFLARELTAQELEQQKDQFKIPVLIQVYGSTVIQNSKRKLLSNYFDFINQKQLVSQNAQWYLIDPQDRQTHYSIFEDEQGTHILASNDLNLVKKLDCLVHWGYTSWFLDGFSTNSEQFIAIVNLFYQAKELIENKNYDPAQLSLIDEELRKLTPGRQLDEGFFNYQPAEIQ